MTQAIFAKRIGVSAKAVQSYEQGWRRMPSPLLSQALLLLALQRARAVRPAPCWKITRCPEARRARCPAFLESSGMFCWLVSGRLCEEGEAAGGRPIRCLKCPVAKRLF